MFSLTEFGIAFPCTVNGFILKIITKPTVLPNNVNFLLNETGNLPASLGVKFTTVVQISRFDWQLHNEIEIRGELHKYCETHCIVISFLILCFTQPLSLYFEFLSCLNKGLNDGWWLRVTHSWQIPEVSVPKLISQVNKTTFRHFPQKLCMDIYKLPHSLIYMSTKKKNELL